MLQNDNNYITAEFLDRAQLLPKNSPFYNGRKLLTMKDLNGNTPEIFLCTTNRSGGKTTYFNHLAVEYFKATGKKFVLEYRYNGDVKKCEDKFFKDIGSLFYPDSIVSGKYIANGKFRMIYIDGVHCGYGLAINQLDDIKRSSHLFADAGLIINDEFQSEQNKYLPDEIKNFISVHNSLARGGGYMSKYLPVICIGNCITMLNPYYVALGISDRLRSDTKFLRGNGFVLEQGFIQAAADAQKDSLFNQAFSSENYVKFSQENVYLNDDYSFIEKPQGASEYIATFVYNRTEYAIREYIKQGFMYVNRKIDSSFPIRISATTDDLRPNYLMLKQNNLMIQTLKTYFQHGCFRFNDLKSKSAILHLLSY